MSVVIGWDIGGAHLKAARASGGRVDGVRQLPTPLWTGLECLEGAFAAILADLGAADTHVITMTGELCDAFASRAAGVVGLSEIAKRHLGPLVKVYAGNAGFVAMADVGAHALGIASANWRASAQWAAPIVADALFIDIGSTTADLIPIASGRVIALGNTDAERLAAGELVYSGMTRSFVMAMAARAPFAGAWTPLMNEYFASSADVHRILGALPADADKMNTADGREKSVEASRARLARMIGQEVEGAPPRAFDDLAGWFAEAQLRDIADAVFLRMSRGDVARGAPIVCAGVGASVAQEIARRMNRSSLAFETLLPTTPESARPASQCAPAAALALIASAPTNQSSHGKFSR